MTNNEEQALKNFLLDADCLKLLDEWTDEFNLFDILRITNSEIRHSNILAWIFDPNENHGLGDVFIKSFITKVASKCDHKKYSVFDLLLQDFYSYQVYRESNHMDIVLLSREEKTVVIIENKIWAGESSHQLNDYVEKSKTEYEDYNQILYVFLTPYGIEASDPEHWIAFSYGEIIDSLENSLKGLILREEVLLLLQNYTSIVRKNIMKEKDEELIRICNEIYSKHKTALRLIFNNVAIDNSIEHEIISETLRELHDDGQIIYKDENKWQFFSPSMDEFLPPLDSADSSWSTNWVYCYWFEKYEDKLIIHLELGGWNLTEKLEKRTNALVLASKKKLDDYRYKRLYYRATKLSQDDYETSIIKATRFLVKCALDNEEKLLYSVNEILAKP